jgi:3-hydroxyisobutyrate dehydrogenase-like beta-hydroxyacid dehydrogenase
MVGAADKAKFDAAAEILRLMGKNIVHCGDVGTGQVCCWVSVFLANRLFRSPRSATT